jgi:hypothetical protein
VHCVHQSRHFVVDRENDTTHIYFSKQLVPGFGIEHSDAFLIKVPPTGGRINALVSMLDRLVILKQDAVYVVSGSGPDALGQQGSYSEPYAVSLNAGCSNRRTVIEVPDGVMFRSRQGIMLLGKSLQMSYVGEPVRYWTDNAVITGVVGRKDKSCVLWFCESQWASGRTNEPYVLVYNYKHEKWSTWSGHMLRAESVTCCTDDRIWLTFGGIVAFSADNYLYDIGYEPGLTQHPINMSLETGWMSFAGIGGFARVYKVFFVGQLIDTTGEATLHMDVAYDYDGYNEYHLEFDKTNIASFDFSTYYGDMSTQANDGYGCVLEATLPRQKCSALKLHIYDDEPATGSKGWSATAFGFLVGIKPQGDQGVVQKVFTKTG